MGIRVIKRLWATIAFRVPVSMVTAQRRMQHDCHAGQLSCFFFSFKKTIHSPSCKQCCIWLTVMSLAPTSLITSCQRWWMPSGRSCVVASACQVDSSPHAPVMLITALLGPWKGIQVRIWDPCLVFCRHHWVFYCLTQPWYKWWK